MTYDSNLSESQQAGTPEFFVFTYGSVVERYTTWPAKLEFQGVNFQPAPIKRSGVSADDKFKSRTMTLTAPMLDAFIRHVANEPVEATRVQAYRAIETDMTDYALFFDGYVMHVSVHGLACQALCEAGSDILDFVYPVVVYQSYCNHSVYDAGCTLDELVWKVTGAITLISGADYSAAGLNAYADGYFTGGYAEYGSDQRLITNHVGNTVTLQVPFDARVAIGSDVDFYPGCQGDPDTCKNKFNNYDHFQGFSLIPSVNPVVWGLK